MIRLRRARQMLPNFDYRPYTGPANCEDANIHDNGTASPRAGEQLKGEQ